MYFKRKKQLIRVFILLVLASLVFFWFVGSSSKNVAVENTVGGAGSLTIVESKNPDLESTSNKDTDNDGLKDWEEALWNTDINNKDTDGDGTSDSEEVALKRDPTKEGPNDQLNLAVNTKQEITITPKSPTTKTEAVAAEFFSNFLKNQGTNLDPSVQTYLNSKIINKVTKDDFKTYAPKDLKITQANDNLSLKNFGNKFGQTFLEDYKFLTENVLFLVENSLAGDETSKNKLISLQSSYDQLINKMLQLSVPSEMTDIMLNFLNDIYKASQLIKRMSLVSEDPVNALTAIKDFQKLGGFVPKNMTEFNLFYITKGITFEMSDYGYLFQALQ